MNILVIGGTRFFGIPMVNELLAHGHNVTIATRGTTPDSYGDSVKRIIIQRTQEESMKNALQGKHFDVVIDKIAYCSNDIKYVMVMSIATGIFKCPVHLSMSRNIGIHWRKILTVIQQNLYGATGRPFPMKKSSGRQNTHYGRNMRPENFWHFWPRLNRMLPVHLMEVHTERYLSDSFSTMWNKRSEQKR